MKTTKLILLLSLIFSPAILLADPITKVNGVAISEARLDQALKSARESGQADSPSLRAAIVQRLVVEELIWQVAKKKKLDETKEAKAAAEEAKRASVIAQYLRQNIQIQEPAEEEMRQFYEQLLARLGEKEYRIRIFRSSDREVLSKSIPQLTRGGELDGQIPEQRQASWVSFPQPLKPGNTNGVPLAVAEAVVRLKVGEVSSLLPLDQEWAIVRLEEERATQIPEYNKIRDTIRKSLMTRQAYVAGQKLATDLAKGAKIEEGTPGVLP